MFIEENPVVSSGSASLFLDKIVYFLEYGIVLVVGAGIFTFVCFYIADKVDGGLLFFLIWLFVVLSFDGTVAPIVFKDVKKLQAKGVIMKNTALGWATIVFFYPFVGLSWYLACKRADYKKQLSNIITENKPQ